MKTIYTQSEINGEIETLKNTFDIVRLVNPVMGSVMKYDGHGELVPGGCFCFEAWNKNGRCKNCISALAFSEHNKQSKLEYIGNKLYSIVARYAVVDGFELVLEAVSSFDDKYVSKILDDESRAGELIRLYRQISVDDLTGLYNRRFFRETLPPLLLKAKSDNAPLGILFIDIDNLNQINDFSGQSAGDSTIKSVAASLHELLRENPDDFIARFGGDEFVAVITNATTEKLETISAKILRAVSRTAVDDYPFIKVSVSIGGAASFEDDNYEHLLALADKRLFRAKSLGKGRYCVK